MLDEKKNDQRMFLNSFLVSTIASCAGRKTGEALGATEGTGFPPTQVVVSSRQVPIIEADYN
jgi:hypothetical protein